MLESLSAKLDELDEKMRADSRLVKAVQEWSACMREKGFDGLAEQEDVDAVLKKKLEEIVGSPGDGSGTNGSEADYDKAALAALQKEEVEMVTADIGCEKNTSKRSRTRSPSSTSRPSGSRTAGSSPRCRSSDRPGR